MARTYKGTKSVGYEYWSRRNHKSWTNPGKYAKKATNKAERRKKRQELQDG